MHLQSTAFLVDFKPFCPSNISFNYNSQSIHTSDNDEQNVTYSDQLMSTNSTDTHTQAYKLKNIVKFTIKMNLGS